MYSRLGRFALAIVLAAGLLSPAAAFAQGEPSPNNPSSGDLVERPRKWDGKTVTFRGEAITGAMVRGDMAWLHLNDDAYYLKNVEEGATLGGYNSGMPVWVAADLARQIQTFGDYKHEGEVVEVRGVFNAACPQHGGDMDIHATTLRRVIAGRDAADPVKSWKVVVALVLAVLAALLWLGNRQWTRGVERGLVTRKRA